MCQLSLVESCAFPFYVTGSRHKGEGLRHGGTMLVFVQRPLSGGSVGSLVPDCGCCTHCQRAEGDVDGFI